MGKRTVDAEVQPVVNTGEGAGATVDAPIEGTGPAPSIPAMYPPVGPAESISAMHPPGQAPAESIPAADDRPPRRR